MASSKSAKWSVPSMRNARAAMNRAESVTIARRGATMSASRATLMRPPSRPPRPRAPDPCSRIAGRPSTMSASMIRTGWVMRRGGFEPPTPRLKGGSSSLAERRSILSRGRGRAGAARAASPAGDDLGGSFGGSLRGAWRASRSADTGLPAPGSPPENFWPNGASSAPANLALEPRPGHPDGSGVRW